MKIINSRNLLSFLSDYLPPRPIIIEAGAFNGVDTKKISAFWPESTIHAFEPVPQIFEQLEKETESFTNICRYPLALSNHTGTALFYVAEHPKRPQNICQAGTLNKPKDRLKTSPITYPHTIEVATITLEDWAQNYKVGHADFIWLDMQGHELCVLQASPDFMQKATLIYLEVNFIPAYENQPTEPEISAWMESQGFIAIARDFEDKPTHFFGNILYQRRNT